MRIVKQMGRILRRPAIWGAVLFLAAAIAGGMALGRMIIGPVLLASNGQVNESHRPTAGAKATVTNAPQSKQTVDAPSDPVVTIDFVKAERPARKHRSRPSHPPDVVYHAPEPVETVEPPKEPEPAIHSDLSDDSGQGRDSGDGKNL